MLLVALTLASVCLLFSVRACTPPAESDSPCRTERLVQTALSASVGHVLAYESTADYSMGRTATNRS